jgi:hypothetical protein
MDFTSGLVAHAVVGGLASVAGGGNFANGAVTASFGYLFNEAGKGPNDRHREGVEAARRDLLARSDIIDVSPGQAVWVPGFEEPRVYDLIATKKGGEAIGIEVKTTIADTIFLNWSQVERDVMVARVGGITTYGQIVSSVSYYTYCYSCNPWLVDIQNATLYVRLIMAGIQMKPGKLGR